MTAYGYLPLMIDISICSCAVFSIISPLYNLYVGYYAELWCTNTIIDLVQRGKSGMGRRIKFAMSFAYLNGKNMFRKTVWHGRGGKIKLIIRSKSGCGCCSVQVEKFPSTNFVRAFVYVLGDRMQSVPWTLYSNILFYFFHIYWKSCTAVLYYT